MKIRKGFISNSSSSSFMVGFPKIPESVEETKRIMFPDGLKQIDEIETSYIANIVFNDMKDKMPYDWRELATYLFHNLYEEVDYVDALTKKIIFDSKVASQHLSDKDRFFIREFAERLSNNKKFKDKIFFKFDYSDNEGEFKSTGMEHGNIFRNLVGWEISNH